MSDETPTYGEGRLSPHARQLMKSLGGDPRFLALTPKQIERWALDRSESPLNLMPDPEVAAAAAKLPDEVWTLTEQDLRERCGPRAPRVDLRVKLAFWDEYERAAARAVPMDLIKVTEGTGAVSWSSFRGDLLTNPNLLAWFMLPPPGYRMQLREAQHMWLSRLMEILELPLTDPKTGKLRPDIGALIIQAGKLIDLRLNGAITQKVVSISASAGSVPDGASAELDMQEVEKKLLELRSLVEGRGPAPRDGAPMDKLPAKEVQAQVNDAE